MSDAARDRAVWAPVGLLSSWVFLSFASSLTGEGALAWSGLADVVVRSEICPAQPGDARPIQYVHHLKGSTSLGVTLAWLLLLISAFAAGRFPHGARRAAQLSLTVSAVALSLYGGAWLESVLLGQPYSELVSCDPQPGEVQAKTDQAHHFHALLAFSFGCLLLPGLRLIDVSTPTSIGRGARRVATWRWAVAALTVLAALLFVSPLVSGWPEMPPDQTTVVKELTALPLLILGMISLAALVPSPRLRPAALDAVSAAAGLAFSSLTALWILRRSHQKWVVGPEEGDYVVRSDLPPEALAGLDAVESFYAYALFSILVIWGASWTVGRLLLPRAGPMDEPALASAAADDRARTRG